MTKKIIGLVIAASLLTGAGSFGTHAYLNTQAAVSENVNIALGNIDVSAYWTPKVDWTTTSQATEAVDTGDGLSYSNVKPGDTFERQLSIVNRGTLKADVVAEVTDKFADALSVEIVSVKETLYGPTSTISEDGTKLTKSFSALDGTGCNYVIMTIKVTVKDTIAEAMTSEEIAEALNSEASDFVVVTATQTTVGE